MYRPDCHFPHHRKQVLRVEFLTVYPHCRRWIGVGQCGQTDRVETVSTLWRFQQTSKMMAMADSAVEFFAKDSWLYSSMSRQGILDASYLSLFPFQVTIDLIMKTSTEQIIKGSSWIIRLRGWSFPDGSQLPAYIKTRPPLADTSSQVGLNIQKDKTKTITLWSHSR